MKSTYDRWRGRTQSWTLQLMDTPFESSKNGPQNRGPNNWNRPKALGGRRASRTLLSVMSIIGVTLYCRICFKTVAILFLQNWVKSALGTKASDWCKVRCTVDSLNILFCAEKSIFLCIQISSHSTDHKHAYICRPQQSRRQNSFDHGLTCSTYLAPQWSSPPLRMP